MRDRAKNIHIARLYGVLSLGWRGSARHWQRYETAYLLLAGLSTPLVLSVHTVVSFDFAIGIIPGLAHDDLPAVLRRGRDLRRLRDGADPRDPAADALRPRGLHHDAPPREHGEGHARDGLIVAYGYTMEAFFGWYSANQYEKFMIYNRMTGPYAWSYWMLIFCNIIDRRSSCGSSGSAPIPTWLFVIAIVVNVGMWLERFVIVVTRLHRDFLPSSWGMYYPTRWDF